MKKTTQFAQVSNPAPRRFLPSVAAFLCLAATFFLFTGNAFSATNGVDLQPSYYNGGNVNFGWSLMNANTAIKAVRIEIEPGSETQAKSWIAQAKSNGKSVIATYHHYPDNGSDSTSALTNGSSWWVANYSALNAAGSFQVNLMNEWGSHNLTSNAYASAYNTAISQVRGVYSGNIIIDIPGWGQEPLVATQAVLGTNGTKISDTNITLSAHVYPGAWNQAANHWLTSSDLDAMGSATGRTCMLGEFGTGSGSADWSGIVANASNHGWNVLGWAWNGDGGSLNMVDPSWSSNPTATSFTTNSYFATIYPLLGGGGSGTVAVTGVAVSPTSASIAVGGTTTLTATVSPSNASNKSVTWTSSNTSVATVSSSGVVTGVAAGSATITVKTASGGFTATAAITVTSGSGGGGTTVTVPFTKDGAGTFTFVTTGTITYINSWNLQSLTVNGVDVTNVYKSGSQLPAKVNGAYTFQYVGNFAWSHFEIR